MQDQFALFALQSLFDPTTRSVKNEVRFKPLHLLLVSLSLNATYHFSSLHCVAINRARIAGVHVNMKIEHFKISVIDSRSQK